MEEEYIVGIVHEMIGKRKNSRKRTIDNVGKNVGQCGAMVFATKVNRLQLNTYLLKTIEAYGHVQSQKNMWMLCLEGDVVWIVTMIQCQVTWLEIIVKAKIKSTLPID